WVRRILTESGIPRLRRPTGPRRQASAGIARAHTLRPILSSWVICDWDLQLATLRESEPMGSYAGQPQLIIELARPWYGLPHRVQPLADRWLLFGDLDPVGVQNREHWRPIGPIRKTGEMLPQAGIHLSHQRAEAGIG